MNLKKTPVAYIAGGILAAIIALMVLWEGGRSMVYSGLLMAGPLNVRQWTIEQLDEMGPAAVSALVMGLKDKDATVRLHAVQALGDLGADGEAAVNMLSKLRDDDPDSEIRSEAQMSLDRILNAKEAKEPW